ncbi:MAG: hypothetical protein ACJAYU_000993 [Bradymonadia bacterium]|jgi:hypothetical protein
MGECVRYLYEHFRELHERPVDRIDLFLVGGGLSAEVGSRVAALCREYARELTVVVTGSVGPGETVTSVAADTLLMHPMATLTTALSAGDRSKPGGNSPGLNSLVTHLIDRGQAADPAYGAMLQRTDAAAVGDAIHRVEWVRHQLEQLAQARLHPPDKAALAVLVDTLTKRVQRVGEPVDRRSARLLEALPVQIPTPDLESLAFDLHIAYEGALELLLRSDSAPRAVIESVHTLHTLGRADEAGEVVEQWVRHFDAPVH